MLILLAEDDRELALAVATALTEDGNIVVAAENGTAANEQLRSHRFDLVLLDIGMPELDGWQVLKQLRRHNRTLPVVLLTARDAVEDRVRGLDLGADDYLVKPVTMAELAAPDRGKSPTGARPAGSRLPRHACTDRRSRPRTDLTRMEDSGVPLAARRT